MQRISRLQAEHLLESHHGRGVMVKDFVYHATLDITANFGDEKIIGELFELRRTLLIEVILSSFQNITTEQSKKIRDQIHQQSREESIKTFLREI